MLFRSAQDKSAEWIKVYIKGEYGFVVDGKGVFTADYSDTQHCAEAAEPMRGVPIYRGWVVIAALVVCLATWFIIEKTSLGATLRAATENPALVQAFGINVPRLITLTYGGGIALAGFAGVLAALALVAGCKKDEFVVHDAADVNQPQVRIGIMTGSTAEGLSKERFPKARLSSFDDIMAYFRAHADGLPGAPQAGYAARLALALEIGRAHV